MKIKPKIYAELLLESIKNKADSKKTAKNFWYMLQKNKQYKDLPKILDILEIESAKAEGKILAKVYSEKMLTADEEKEIKEKLLKYFTTVIPVKTGIQEVESQDLSGSQIKSGMTQDSIQIKNIINPAVTGIIAKIDDNIIDTTVENKISKLSQTIKH